MASGITRRMLEKQPYTGCIVFLFGSTILWSQTLFVVIFSAIRYNEDFSKAYLMNSCNNSTGQSALALMIVECLVASCLMKEFVCPLVFGKNWYDWDSLKQRKMVAYLVKLNVRVSVTTLMLVWVVGHFSFESGLFAGRSNMKDAWQRLGEGEVVTCSEFDVATVHGLRAWTLARFNLMALMLWEICYIPEMGFEMWVHHGVICLTVVLGSDPVLLARLATWQPLFDGMSFFGMLGGGLLAVQEICVMQYHLTAPDAKRQAWWMQAALWLQALLCGFCFFLFPVVIIVRHSKDLGLGAVLPMAGIGALTVAEIQMVRIKMSVVRHAKKKLLRDVEQPVEQPRTTTTSPSQQKLLQDGEPDVGQHVLK